MAHPDLQNPMVAKRAAMALASAMGADVTQSPDGKTKRVLLRGGRQIDCATWYAAWSVLYRLRLDQITKGKGR